MFENSNIIIISPHLDDAVFSLASFISRYISQNNISVINVFSNSNFAYETLFGDSIEITNKRKQEDILALSALGVVEIFNIDIDEAPLRGYSLHKIFKNDNKNYESEQKIVSLIKNQILNFIKPDNILLIPSAFGYHIDHLLVNLSMKEFKNIKYFYADLPYASSNEYNNVYAEKENYVKKVLKIDISDTEIESHLKICSMYKTQYLCRFSREITHYLTKNGIHLWH